MKLVEIFDLYPSLGSQGKLNVHHKNMMKKLTKITPSTCELVHGDVFCAYKGTAHDGHNFLQEAIDKGAIALIIENKEKLPLKVKIPVLIVADARAAFQFLSSKFFQQIDQKLYLIGVTGTNGKTSITYLLEYMLAQENIQLGVMGTVNHRVAHKVWKTNLTTPDSWTLYHRLQQFHRNHAEGAVLEVSSHALDQNRVGSLNFDVAIFTNLSRDHLDYHKTMNAYFTAKERLFSELMDRSNKSLKLAVINGDDLYGRKIKTSEQVEKIYFGKRVNNDFSFKILSSNYDYQKVELRYFDKTVKFSIPLIGEHSIYNLIPVIIVGYKNGLDIKRMVSSFQNFPGVPGRFQRVIEEAEKNIFIDYAHTPDALKKVLTTLFNIRKQNKLKNKIIVLFGCGGDRDKGKRPIMGQIAAKYADKVVIASDNPRTEDPQMIIKEILKGIKDKKKVHQEVDRRKAIRFAYSLLAKGDVLVVCGKGHENYQIIGSKKKHFSDYEEVQKCLN